MKTFNEFRNEDLAEAMTYSGLDSFKDDESMLDDLQYDLELAGLSSKDYKLDTKNGKITFKKMTSKLKDVIRQYQLSAIK